MRIFALTAKIRRFIYLKMIDLEYQKWWQSFVENVDLTRSHRNYCKSSLFKQLLRNKHMNDLFLHIKIIFIISSSSI